MMQPINGSFVALVTPMHKQGEIDFDSLKKLVEWQVQEGSDGIVSVGTTGESATLSVKEHLEVVAKTVEYANGRLLVIAGTGSNSTSQAIETTVESKKVGADACLLVTPYYNKPSQNGLIQHYTKIAESVDIPQILYNVPTRTSCDILPETVEILSQHKNIVGIKESVSDENRINDLIKISKSTNDSFSILSGDDPTFVKLMELGGHGVISVAANVIPKSISEICSLMRQKNLEEAFELNECNKHLYDLLFVESNPVPVKWMLSKMEMIQNYLRLPLVQLDEKFHQNIHSEMIKLGLL